MTLPADDLRPKVHPASREALPDDPLELRGATLPGDARSMLRLLVEEFARMGWDADGIIGLARDPFYGGLHELWRLYGEEVLRAEVSDVLGRAGVLRVRTTEIEPPSARFVPLDLPGSS